MAKYTAVDVQPAAVPADKRAVRNGARGRGQVRGGESDDVQFAIRCCRLYNIEYGAFADYTRMTHR